MREELHSRYNKGSVCLKEEGGGLHNSLTEGHNWVSHLHLNVWRREWRGGGSGNGGGQECGKK
jgi:hypothetical protein